MPKVLPGYSAGRLPGRSTKEKGREKERYIRSQIVQEVVACITEKVSVHSGDKEPYRHQLGKVSREAGIVRESKMKKGMKAGEKGTRWQHSGRKSKNWKRSWNEEELKETP